MNETDTPLEPQTEQNPYVTDDHVTVGQFIAALSEYPAHTPICLPGRIEKRLVPTGEGDEEVEMEVMIFDRLLPKPIPWARVIPEIEVIPEMRIPGRMDNLIMMDQAAEGMGLLVVILPVKSLTIGGVTTCGTSCVQTEEKSGSSDT